MNKLLIVTIPLLLLFCSCEQTEFRIGAENGPEIDDVIKFESTLPESLVADSADHAEITIAINKIADMEYDSVLVTTDLGYFSNNTQSQYVVVNADKKTSFLLNTGTKSGTAHIRARILGYSIEESLTFEKAYPTGIAFESTILKSTNDSVSTTINLFRESGVAYESQKVALSYTSLDSTNALIDLPQTLYITDGSGKLSIKNPLEHTGRFEVEASALNQSGNTISAQLLIVFE